MRLGPQIPSSDVFAGHGKGSTKTRRVDRRASGRTTNSYHAQADALSRFPLMVEVALGEPGATAFSCCAETVEIIAQAATKVSDRVAKFLDI